MDINSSGFDVDSETGCIVSIVSKVIVSSCQPQPYHSINIYVSAFVGIRTVFGASEREEWTATGPMLIQTGSSAEFYIRPIVPCRNDVDLMGNFRNTLIVETDKPKFPQISEACEEIVKTYILIPYNECPGFVSLRSIGTFRYNWKSEEYVFYGESFGLLSHPNPTPESDEFTVSGPAHNLHMKLDGKSSEKAFSMIFGNIYASIDMVSCIPCYFWPTVAVEWKIRVRRHRWPSKSLIHNVVSNGCDVVFVSHPNFTDDKYMFRLSFSRAEITLIRSWSLVQQVVYHMLRFFAKQELVKTSWKKENKILCTYHIKTLMLWSCENESEEFWNQYVIEICCKLLRRLADSLNQRFLSNYFIPKCNLFDHICNETNRRQVIETLKTFEKPCLLGHWFYFNYIGKSEALLSLVINALIRSGMHEENFPTSVAKIDVDSYHRKNEEVERLGSLFSQYISNDRLSPSKIFLISRIEVDRVGHWYAECATMMQMLRLVKHIYCRTISFDELKVFECIATINKRFEVHSYPATYRQRLPESKRYFFAAEEMMSGLTCQSTASEILLLTELSMQCLKKYQSTGDCLKNLNCQNRSVLYLGFLRYARGETSLVVDLCSKLLNENHGNSRITEQTRETVDGRLFLFVDDIANILGFLILYRYVNSCCVTCSTNTKEGKWTYFKPEGIALHLLTLCESETGKMALSRLGHSPTLPDQCLMILTAHKRKLFGHKKRITTKEIIYPCLDFRSSEKTSSTDYERNMFTENSLINLLMDVYFDKLKMTFDSLRNDLKLDCFLDTLFRTLYAFRCGQYNTVLSLCDQLEEKIAHAQRHHITLCLICGKIFFDTLGPPVDIILEDGIRLVFGLYLLIKLVLITRHNPDIRETFENTYDRFGRPTEGKLRIHEKSGIDKITGAFVAKYLRILCLMKTNRPIKEITVVYKSIVGLLENSSSLDRAVFLLLRRRVRLFQNATHQHEDSI